MAMDEERPVLQEDCTEDGIWATAVPQRRFPKARSAALAAAALLAAALAAALAGRAVARPDLQKTRRNVISAVEVADGDPLADAAAPAEDTAEPPGARPAALAAPAAGAGATGKAKAAPPAAKPAPQATAAEAVPAEPAVATEDFDCAAGFANAEAGWSADKKKFCCETHKRGCQDKFDCAAGFANAEAGWSAEKKKFCCETEQTGCQETPATNPAGGILPKCAPDLGFCPESWADDTSSGGFYCPNDNACQDATAGPFDPEFCPDQCAIGSVPADVMEKLKTTKAKLPRSGAKSSAKVAPKGSKKKAKQAKADINGISFCSEDVLDCPGEWRDGPEGGYLCQKGDQKGACQPWKAGPFDKKGCKTFCAIGYMPTTSTSTSTVTTITTTTKKYNHPALICYAVARYGEEMDILQFQHDNEAGIFACDETIVFADDAGKMKGGFPLTELPVKTDSGGGWSKDGTAANAELFLTAWEGIKKDGRWESVDWAIKVDPDAVLLPDRMRLQLKEATGSATYVKNCNKYDGPDWPLMFGAAEAISQQALSVYWDGEQRCKDELEDWESWGEDYFMSHCLDHLGVEAFLDTEEIGDNLCLGAWCGDGGKAAFHPFKSTELWAECWREATGQNGGGDGEGGGDGGDGGDGSEVAEVAEGGFA